jgi:hypothetical protein
MKRKREKKRKMMRGRFAGSWLRRTGIAAIGLAGT